MPSPPLKAKIKKPKLLRSNPTRLSLLNTGNPIGYYLDDEDMLSGYRYPKKKFVFEKEINDYIKLRLFLARELALKKYKEKWG